MRRFDRGVYGTSGFSDLRQAAGLGMYAVALDLEFKQYYAPNLAGAVLGASMFGRDYPCTINAFTWR